MDTQQIYRALTRASDEQLIAEIEQRGFVSISKAYPEEIAQECFSISKARMNYEQVAAPQREGQKSLWPLISETEEKGAQ